MQQSIPCVLRKQILMPPSPRRFPADVQRHTKDQLATKTDAHKGARLPASNKMLRPGYSLPKSYHYFGLANNSLRKSPLKKLAWRSRSRPPSRGASLNSRRDKEG